MEIKTLKEAKEKWPEIPLGKTALKPGDKFNRLTLSQRTEGNRVTFVCQCECGSYIKVSGTDVKIGHTKSCGCLQKEISSQLLHNLRSNQPANNRENFSYLQEVGENGFKFIEDIETKDKVRYCKFLCPICNKEYIGKLANIKHNLVKSCGCTKSDSFGVIKIKNILQNNNIDYKTEYTFSDCKNQKLLPFDFYFIYNNQKTIIEFDGSQHYMVKWSEEDFKNTQINDKIKNQYCINNNIFLYRIPYYDENKINILEDILNEKYLIKD